MLTPKDTAFHVALREHLVDEGRHQIFFQMLMRHICQEIDEPTRLALGRLLPGFLDALILDRDSWREVGLPHLRRLPFDPAPRRPFSPRSPLPPNGDAKESQYIPFTSKRPFTYAT